MFELPALLIIDMQRGMSDPAVGARNNTYAEANIARLLGAWRHAQGPVVHVRHISRSPDSPFWPGQCGVEFQPALAPWEGEHVVEKNVPDAFIHSGLERWLRVRDIQRLVVVGVSTSNSVEASVRSAGNLGFDVTVVHDATFTFAKRDYAGVERSADEVHAMSLANLNGEYARIRSTEEMLDEALEE
ncbi:cysteine hydrolase family protein [Halomonas sp. GD1P12]|uniref:cysteine hydrolase family protein n=1 Tax=Halomonas sp. GD1P12 TaxID=2982691 RepID=UPI0021E476A2|nr:cysteine hydrolase family protein [Halomonas sp. GD1P12]UYG01188.1 cysteine hydrolase [Halomonas sp. GD1P12]